jgi:hemolysin III
MYYGERLNSISHLIGAALSLMALGALLTVGLQTQDFWTIFSFSVFGFTLVLLYTMSTLYHSFADSSLKKLFQLFDHISIYLLIAGTYTPFMLISLKDSSGYLILGVIWVLAGVGTLSEIFLSGRWIKSVQILIYLSMGWACSLDYQGLEAALPEAGLFWLVAGGLSYTVGIIFYILDKMKLMMHAHGIWHFFVLAGSACHFISIIGYVR